MVTKAYESNTFFGTYINRSNNRKIILKDTLIVIKTTRNNNAKMSRSIKDINVILKL